MPPLLEPAATTRDLARLTTLELGGAARQVVTASEEREVIAVLRSARRAGEPLVVLGGGSNVVVADAGYPGTVLLSRLGGMQVEHRRDRVEITVGAGGVWDHLVAHAVAEEWAGIECLAGIPGTVGATPIQNVGAYGQEVGDVLLGVRAFDRRREVLVELGAPELELGYRSSRLRREPDRFVVLAVRFALRPGGVATVRYAELARSLGVEPSRAEATLPVGAGPSLAAVREAVLALRRSKSMVLDPADPNRRSVGSFFTNPVVPVATADAVERRARVLGVLADGETMPRFAVVAGASSSAAGSAAAPAVAPGSPATVKLPAAWLIERAGFERGLRRGAVGISSRHTLALVHHGGGTTRELLALAAEIQRTVQARFGVWLTPEPIWLGPPGPVPAPFAAPAAEVDGG